jgi:hypothetical protein
MLPLFATDPYVREPPFRRQACYIIVIFFSEYAKRSANFLIFRGLGGKTAGAIKMKVTKADREAHDTSKPDGLADATAGVNDASDEASDSLPVTVAAVAIVGVGVAVFEAALLPGVILGAAAVLAPKFVPQLGSALKPLFKSTVRGAYKISQKTREFVAETHEHVQDIVAEVDADVDKKGASLTETASSAAPGAK